MNHKGHRLVIGSIVAAGLASILLAVVTLNGFQSYSIGDLAVSSTISSWILLVGAMAVLSLELAHAMRRRPRHATMAQASEWRALRPHPR